LGTGNGRVNWGVAATEGGSGGFAAISGDARVDLIATDVRDEIRWRQNSFVFEDNALMFNSHTADSVIEWYDHIGLNSGTGANPSDNFYSAREFLVLDNPNSTTDRAVITGEIRSFARENGGLNADLLKTGPGVLELAAPQNTYLGNTLVKEGTLIIRGAQNSSGYRVMSGANLELHGGLPRAADFRLDGGNTTIAGARSVRSVVIRPLANLTVARPDTDPPPGPAVLTAKYLEIQGGRLDLLDNALVVDYEPGFIPEIFAVRGRIRDAYANGANNGPGITSSLIANNPGTAIGYAEAATLLNITGDQTGTFLGQTVDATSILARYTLSGDANLNGAVAFEDLVALAQNYNTTTGEALWTQGDFNHDGNVNFADLVLLAQSYNTSVPAAGTFPAAFESDLAAAFASVPEPAALSLTAAALTLAARRRRR
jgi:autotransporter-associated beta strand protein